MRKSSTGHDWVHTEEASTGVELRDGDHVAVIGGGPAGTFFSYFFLDMAERAGLEVSVDIYESRDFSGVGPAACNMCGGIISESLVQHLATEGIILPSTVVQRGIDSYVLHMDVGSVRLETPLHEMRIGAVHRASGPRDLEKPTWESFDGFLLSLACKRGARLVRERVTGFDIRDGVPGIQTKSSEYKEYNLIVIATGVNSRILERCRELLSDYNPPRTTGTYICEYRLGAGVITESLGNSMHVFLQKIPGLEFAAIIPKGDYASVCLLGDRIDADMVQSFLNSPEVRGCMPNDWRPDDRSCRCSPLINIGGSPRPFGDRIVFIGDAGVSRLYKDGIGAAYRTAKAAASTAVFQGVSARDFERHYLPLCRELKKDNGIGKLVFTFTKRIKGIGIFRRAIYH
ncbi:MAG: hypothetical protein JSU64_03010, partial [candidate division WOR-3 bacterium]